MIKAGIALFSRPFLPYLFYFPARNVIFNDPIANMATSPGSLEKDTTTVNTATTGQKTARTGKKKSKEIKYEDKSAGQPQLVVIFDRIKALMKSYAKGVIREREKPGAYSLVIESQIEVAGKKFSELYFAGILVQKGYIGFYYMPVYCLEEIKQELKPELLKCLKGKCCFYIRKNDPVLMDQIDDALKVGYNGFEKRGWV